MQNATFKPKYPMPEQDVNELTYMLKNPTINSDQIGYMLSDGPEAVSWWTYYIKTGRKTKADALYRRLAEGKQYMVACQWPVWFDGTFDERHVDKRQKLIAEPRSITPQEKARVNAMIDRLQERHGNSPP